MMDTFNEQTVTQIFEQQVLSTPERIAVYDQFTSLTYQQLNEKANQLAHWLRHKGITPGDFVALLLEPGIEFIICILGIIKAGVAYLPLDVNLPKKRLEKILNDAAPYLLIADKKYCSIESEKCPQFLIKDLQKISSNFHLQNPIHNLSSQAPIYMLYTSGSTGNPKGIIIPHCAIVNLINIVDYFSVNEKAIIAQCSNLAFDASILEIWSALLKGGTLSIVPLHVRKNISSLKNFLLKNNISHLFLTTGYFHQIAQFLPEVLNPIKMLIFGGEKINPVVVRNFINYRKKINLPITLVNAYGPTEATVAICRYVINEKYINDLEQLSSIGKPIDNVKTYILNEKQEVVPPGKVGELYVSGINLALGYSHDEKCNREKFITNIFDSHYPPFQRLYKTGDLVRQLPDGNLIYIGRIDDQVKVQGFRVYIGEIETQLLNHPAISAAVVLSEKDVSNRTFLTAYLVFSDPQNALTSDQIKKYLSIQLPSYMLPARYIKINQIPLTAIGKVDKKQLPNMKGVDLVDIKILPSNIIEKRLTAIFAMLLKVNCIDVTQNLFDLGMNSLLLIEACHEISQKFQWPLPLEAIITYPSIQTLSDYMQTELSRIDDPVKLK